LVGLEVKVLSELAPGVFVETGFEGGNVGLVMTERGALLVDAPMLPNEAREWQATLREMGADPYYAIVNTDYHPERMMGNGFFMPTRVFGHEASLKPIAKYDGALQEQFSARYQDSYPVLAQEIREMRIVGPEIAVGDGVTLYLGERRAEVLFLEGHTPASLGLYLPEERVLFAGDNITHSEHPALFQANSLAWLGTLDRIRAMDVEIIVPGSGAPCGKEAIELLHAYIVEMHARVKELFQKGASRRECVEKVGMLEFFPVPREQEALIRRRRRESIERVYTEVRMAVRKRR
jgi:cyclase